MKVIKFTTLLLCAMTGLGLLIPAMPLRAADAPVKKPAAASMPATPWTVRCNKNEKNEGPRRGRCEMFQRLVVKETGQRFVEMAIGFPKNKNDARGIIIVPLGVLLQPGMQLKIDDGKPFKFQPRFCDAGGCYGYLDLNNDILTAMQKGTKLTLSFIALSQKVVNVELSLKDFGKALKDIS